MAERKPAFNPDVEKLKEKEDEGEEDLPPKKIKSEEESEEDKKPKDGEDDDDDDIDDEDDDIDDEKIPVKKSVQQHIIGRQKKTIEKLRSKKEEEVEEIELPKNEDDDLSPEAATAVNKAVKKAVDPLMNQLASKTDEDELQGLFSSDPESKKYEKRIRSYMRNDSWKGIPPSAIYHHLAFNNAEATGAKRKNAADVEAGLNKGGGRSIRPRGDNTGNVPSIEEMEDMTDEEIEGIQNKVRRGDFKKE